MCNSMIYHIIIIYTDLPESSTFRSSFDVSLWGKPFGLSVAQLLATDLSCHVSQLSLHEEGTTAVKIHRRDGQIQISEKFDRWNPVGLLVCYIMLYYVYMMLF